MKAQYAILRFAKYKGPTMSRIEAHNERTKETYASNPDIKTELSKHNFHPVVPQGKYRDISNRIIREAGCRVRKDSVTAVEALITASPEFFEKKSRKEVKEFFDYAVEFMRSKQNPDTYISAVVHVDEKTPHMHLCFVPITVDGRLSAKEIIGNKKRLTQWQDEFWSYMVKKYPDFERGESASLTGRTHIPPRLFKQAARLNRQKDKHSIPQGHPSALALSTLSHASNLDWRSVSHMIIYMFQCYSLKSSHPCLLPQSLKVCSKRCGSPK